MSKYKLLSVALSFLALLCFNIKAHAITENQYLVINKLINEENIDKAFSELKHLQKKENKLSSRGHILIGKIYLALEQPAKAYSFFEKATFTSVLNHDLAYAGMSMSAIKLGNLSDAKIYANKALNENPDLVEAKLALGLIFTDYGEIKKAEKYFKKAILTSRNSLMSVRAYASSKMREGQHKEARDIITIALLEQKSDAATTDLLGKLFWIEGNIKEAVRLRSEASEMFRKSGNIQRAEQIVSWLNTSAIPKVNEIKKIERIEKEKIEKKEIEKRKKISQPKLVVPKKIKLKPQEKPEEIFIDKNKPTFTGSGIILNDGKWIITNRHIIDGSKYIIVRNGLGYAYTKLNQLDKALASYNKAISINNKNSYAYFNSGLLLENQGINKKAADYFYSAGTSSLLVKDFKMANNAYNALQRLSNQESYITKKTKKLKELIAELSVFNDNNFKIVKVNTKGN